MSEKIRVALVDDHSLCRRGLTELLTHRYGITVVGSTDNGDELTALVARASSGFTDHGFAHGAGEWLGLAWREYAKKVFSRRY